MKKKITISVISCMILLFTACEETFISSDFEENASVIDTTNVANNLKAATVSAPTISSVTGSYGSSIPNTHPLYNTYLLASYSTGSQIKINGSNFGTDKGSVILEKASGTKWGIASSYSVSIISWSNTQIVIKLYSSLDSEPIACARFKVTFPNKSVASSKTIPIVNSTSGRLFGECTYHSVTRTLQNGLSGWSPSYSSSGVKSITASYIPTKNDVLIWGSKHQAFIESVRTSKSGYITTYDLTITERNVTGSASGGGYSTAVVNYTTTVKVNSKSKEFVSGYSTYRSTLKAGADKVREQ